MNIKKLIASVSAVCLMLLTLAGCATTGTDTTATTTSTTTSTTGSSISSIVMIVVIFAVFYFLMIRPEKKRKQKAQEMRDGVEVGDKIVTIGGMVGKVVHVSGEKLTFETGEDRVRIEVMKWAISSNEGKGKKEGGDSEETLENT